MFIASVDLSGFRVQARRSLDTIHLGIADAARNGAIEGAAEAKAVGRFKNRTGYLRAGIVARLLASSFRSVQWEILSLAPYSRYVESGTRPHMILPRNGVALRFMMNGQEVFARKVNHPGTKAQPFMGPALLKAGRVMRRELELLPHKLQKLWD